MLQQHETSFGLYKRISQNLNPCCTQCYQSCSPEVLQPQDLSTLLKSTWLLAFLECPQAMDGEPPAETEAEPAAPEAPAEPAAPAAEAAEAERVGFTVLSGLLMGGPHDKGILLLGDLDWGSPIFVSPHVCLVCCLAGRSRLGRLWACMGGASQVVIFMSMRVWGLRRYYKSQNPLICLSHAPLTI